MDAAIAVHRAFGPGLLESVYESALSIELLHRGLRLGRQVPVALTHRGVAIDAPLRMDLVVEQRVVVELKSVEALTPIHRAQLLTYLRLSGLRVGLLINFNTSKVRDGIQRLVHSPSPPSAPSAPLR